MLKKNLIFSGLFLVFGAFILACSETSKIDFSGEWELNRDKSELPEGRRGGPGGPGGPDGAMGQDRPGRPERPNRQGGEEREGRQGRANRPGMIASKMKIEQAGIKMAIERFSRRSEESSGIKESYTLNGKEVVNRTDNSERITTAKWSSEGESLLIETTTVVQRGDNTIELWSSEEWKLIDSGNSLSIDFTIEMPFGERKGVRVYDRAGPD